MRHNTFLWQRYRIILGYTGIMLLIISMILLLPLSALFFFPDEADHIGAFGIAGLSAIFPGCLCVWLFPIRENTDLTYAEGTVIVVISWIIAILLGAYPFIAVSNLTFTQAIFESSSGWTTTGLTVIDVGRAPHIILLHRSILQWMGGAGFAIIMLSALAGPAGTGLSTAEGRESQLVPNIQRSATVVLIIYTIYTLAGMSALYLAGMNGFDAVNHAFTAISTGGFSTRSESIAYWKNPNIEAIIIVLMLLGSTNFFSGYLFFRRKVYSIYRNSEIRLELLILMAVIPLLLIMLFRQSPHTSLNENVRVAVFETVSALSTTGFSISSYSSWNAFGIITLMLLMLIGGGTGSTSGGIKLYRIAVLCRGLIWEFKRRRLPDTAITEPDVWHGEQRRFISDDALKHNALYVFLYLCFFVIGGMVIIWHEFSLQDSLFEFASTVGTVGLSAGITGADTPAVILWLQSMGMLLGRLEFFAVLVGIIKLMTDLKSIRLWHAPEAGRK
jgi:trk system potassium uptake protein TrkH